jgi:TatD DNase family protein
MRLTKCSFVDFHCHLDLYPDLAQSVAACEAARVFTLAVTTTPKAWRRNNELASKTRYVRAALGLHPQLVADRAHELKLWEELLPQSRYVGEVGLDAGPRFFRSLELQKQVFQQILSKCAKAGDKIVSVHSVRTVKSVLDMVEAHLPASRGRVVLHWFTGTKAEARRAVELGCYFSINYAMTTNEKHKAVLAELPLQRLLTETDGPFTKTADRPAEPPDAELVVVAMAKLRGQSAQTMCSQVMCNLKTMLGDVGIEAPVGRV